MQDRLIALVERPWFNQLVIVAILANAVTLGLETSRPLMAKHGTLFHTIDLGFIIFFTGELLLKLAAYRGRFFRNGWNLFDFAIVVITLLPFLGNVSVLRALRILRVLRLLSIVPQFRIVISAFFNAIPGISAISWILLMLLYVFSVLGSKLFGDRFPELFASLPSTLFTMFQVMTLDGWSEIARPIMDVYPLSWIFFCLFIVVMVFIVFNLFMGVVNGAVQKAHEEATAALIKTELGQNELILAKISAVETTLAELRRAINQGSKVESP